MYVTDNDYLLLPCSVLSKINEIIVCKETHRRLRKNTYQVLQVMISNMPPALYGLFCKKEDAIKFAKIIESEREGKEIIAFSLCYGRGQ